MTQAMSPNWLRISQKIAYMTLPFFTNFLPIDKITEPCIKMISD